MNAVLILIMILIGNVLSLIALVILLIAISKKENKELIKLQGISHLFFALSGLLLRGYSGVVQDAVGTFRSYFIYKDKNTRNNKTLLVLVGIAFGLIFNNKGIIGVLPIVGTFQYTLVSTNTSNIKIVKYSILINSVLMLFYSFSISNYANIITNVIIMFMTIYDIRNAKEQ